MKLNIEFLQTGGVPLTNDLMANIMEAIKLYDVVGSLAGHMTILAGCDPVSGSTSNVNPGVVAINDEVLYFEGGLITTNVFVSEEQISKPFQDQQSKVLIKKRTVKFGNATPPNSFPWSDFVKLQTLKSIQQSLASKANQTQVDDHEARLKIVELKTAPIVNGGVVWAWFKPKDQIPDKWKEAVNIKGKAIVGLDESNAMFASLGNDTGSNEIQITAAQLPQLTGQFQTLAYDNDNGSGISTAVFASPASVGGSSGQWRHKQIKIQFGGNQKLSLVQKSVIAYFIEPNF